MARSEYLLLSLGGASSAVFPCSATCSRMLRSATLFCACLLCLSFALCPWALLPGRIRFGPVFFDACKQLCHLQQSIPPAFIDREVTFSGCTLATLLKKCSDRVKTAI